MTFIPIKGEKGSIIIHILRYERENANNISDANWLVAEVEIYVGSFSGKLNLSLTTQDLIRFDTTFEKILENLNGRAQFDTDECVLSFSIEMKALGNAEIKGIAKDFLTDTELKFNFNTDQSYLVQTKPLLDMAIKKFAIIREV